MLVTVWNPPFVAIVRLPPGKASGSLIKALTLLEKDGALRGQKGKLHVRHGYNTSMLNLDRVQLLKPVHMAKLISLPSTKHSNSRTLTHIVSE